MKRFCAALAVGLLLVGVIPSSASAEKVTRFNDQFLFAECEVPIEGGFIAAFIELSTEGGFAFMGADIWFDPDNPFETLPTVSGFTESFDLTDDGTIIQGHASLELSDQAGDPTGDAELVISVARTGDQTVFAPEPGKTNENERTRGMEEELAGSGTLTIDETEFDLSDCTGVIGDISFKATNPTAFMVSNSGARMECEWETDTVFAEFDVVDSEFGLFSNTFLETPDIFLGSIGETTGSMTATELDVTVGLDAGESAVATATFTPIGGPVDSTHVAEALHQKRTDQALDPNGTIVFSTGDTFEIDDEHCDARTFELHNTESSPKGPKSRTAPSNDAPAGAIALDAGERFNTSNVGATGEAEIQIETCPEEFDDEFGRTLWYTVEGTGDPVTIDTAGSGIDTLIGVFVPTGSGFDEIACNDDVEFEPIGSTLQAAVTFDTEEGVTYYVEVGGFWFVFDDPSEAEAGRIRLSVR